VWILKHGLLTKNDVQLSGGCERPPRASDMRRKEPGSPGNKDMQKNFLEDGSLGGRTMECSGCREKSGGRWIDGDGKRGIAKAWSKEEGVTVHSKGTFTTAKSMAGRQRTRVQLGVSNSQPQRGIRGGKK